MGCNASKANPNFQTDNGATNRLESVVVVHPHVSRTGNINLSRRSLTGLDGKTLRDILNDKLNRTPKSLQLSENHLHMIGREILVLPSLEKIDLESNMFKRVPEVLTHLENLTHLSMSFNLLDEKALGPLRRIQSLKCLSLRECSLKTFPIDLIHCPVLEELDISRNPDIQFDGLPSWDSPNMKVLLINDCAIKGDELPSVISNLPELVRLDISGNNFQFENMNFFGHNIPRTLKVLHLRSMNLTSVPQALVPLRQLHSLDIAENPIETLDVLVGRVVMRPPASTGCVTSPTVLQPMPSRGAEPVDNLEPMESGSVFSGQISLTNLSRIVGISTVAQPITLKRLCLRACHLKTVPKYFHKLCHLEELDISDNEELNDPNMTLFSLENLRVLIIIGCPFAVDLSKSNNEWYDISKLRNLKQLDWTVWKNEENSCAYTTRLPIEICGLQLNRINGVELAPGLFVGDPLSTIINLLNDGYFKVDLAMNERTVYNYIDTIKVLHDWRSFFSPSKSSEQNTDVPGSEAGTQSATRPPQPELGHSLSSSSIETVLESILSARLRIVVSRYIFFLTAQAANFDAIMIPPLDVVILHYAILTTNPVSYRSDCEAICGRILNCNYRDYFLDFEVFQDQKKENVRTSKTVWNFMGTKMQETFLWLSYEFWHQRVPKSSASAETLASAFVYLLPCDPFPSKEAAEDELAELNKFHPFKDLSTVLDPAITEHFSAKGIEVYREAVKKFFSISSIFIQFEDSLRNMFIDWSRYVKFLSLCSLYNAKTREQGNVIVENLSSVTGFRATTPRKTTSLIGKRYDELEEKEASICLPDRRASSILRSNNQLVECATRCLQYNPVPTIGLLYLLHAHRTAHVKYFQILSLFGLEANDITWDDRKRCVGNTSAAWKILYKEHYYGGQKKMFLYELKESPRCESLGLLRSSSAFSSEEYSCPMLETAENTPYLFGSKKKGKSVSFFFGSKVY